VLPLIFAGAVAAAWIVPDILARHATTIPVHEAASGTSVTAPSAQVAVLDGETLRVQQTVVRLDGIAAPPRGHQCQRPDGSAFDCGAASAEALAALVRDRKVACELKGEDHMEHPLGICQADGQNLNQAQVASGWARAGQASLGSEEESARAQRRGLWAVNYNP
jgi:endonuclease YncB( thermonuclease family)